MKMFRKKVMIPVFVAIVLLLFVKIYLLDAITRSILIKASEKVFKAKTEISQVKVSLLAGEITVRRINVGDKSAPYFNLFSIEKGHFKFSLVALLRKHIHIDDALIEGLEFHTARKTSAYLPEEPTGKIAAMMEKLAEKPLAELKKEYSLASLSKRLRIDEITDLSKLKTLEKVNDAKDYFQTLPDNLTAQYNGLEINKKIEQINSDIESIKTFKPKKIEDYQEYITRIQAIQATVIKVQESVTSANRIIDQSYKTGQNKITDVGLQANLDIAAIKDKIALANYSKQHIFEEIIGDSYKSYLKEINHYYSLYKQVFPAKTTGLESWVKKYNVPGQDISFPNHTIEAKFLIKNMGITGFWQEHTQKFKGIVKEITSDQNIRRIPTTFVIGSEALNSNKKFLVNGLADFRGNAKLTKVALSYTGAPLNKYYWDTKTIPLGIDSGTYALTGDLSFNGDVFSTAFKVEALNANMSKVSAYDDKNIFHQLLARIFMKHKDYYLGLKSDGLNCQVDSNIDKMIAQEVAAYIQEQIDKLKADIQRQWDAKVAEYTAMVMAQYNAARKQVEDRVNVEINKGRKQLDDYQKLLTTMQKEQENKLKKLQEQARALIDEKKAQGEKAYNDTRLKAENKVASASVAAQQKADLAAEQAKAEVKRTEDNLKKEADLEQAKINASLTRKTDDIFKKMWH